ncbi:MAG: SpoIID/LytB domain-containing protein [Schleiferiaceae bacterium]|nr:SpoIID/LytB domain-containing protein [Schleiferiaceae bacterium]
MKGPYFKLILTFCWVLQLGAQTAPRVLIFADQEYSRLQIKVKGGSYTLTAFTPDSIFTMEYESDDVHPLYTFRGDLRLNRAGCDSIRITTQDTFVVRVLRGKKWTAERPYLGDFTLRPNLIYLEGIVRSPIAPYIAGVVEAEGGSSSTAEAYYKAQAVLARTWLITNFKKHISEGYHIKDDQSSQAYKGLPHSKNAPVIAKACAALGDTIALHNNAPIIGFYHSNSGGYTALPEQVWSKALPYCREVLDPFSKKGSKAVWEKTYSWEEWQKYWSRSIEWTVSDWTAFFSQLPDTRSAQWTLGTQTFKMETVRRDFKWRSAYVLPQVTDEGIVVHGYGFGHGVGMAQQGAMLMGKAGFDWKEILDFYFKDLEFKPVQNL